MESDKEREAPLFDLSRSLGDLSKDRAFIATLVEVFRQDLEKEKAKLAEALRTMKADEIRNSAHSLKNSATSFGAPGATDAARKLETAAKMKEYEALPDLAGEVIMKFDELSRALEESLKDS
ncbi:MAG: Hpt domain-containing protein [Candidatus Eremiobacteraeota bacterium]|nr:Hpt domain-containing protein [Candidatus Eremiobacteraeota bacterium]